MNTEHDDILTGRLALAIAQMIDTPAASTRPADLDAVVLGALAESKVKPRHSRPASSLARYALAASLAIGVGLVFWLGVTGGKGSVYAAVGERLEKLRTIVYRVQWVDEAGLVNAVAGDGDKVTYVAPSHDRIERANGTVLVIDTELGRAIELVPTRKEARVLSGQMAGSMAAMARGPVSLLDTLRKHFRAGATRGEGVEALKVRTIDGVQALGLRSKIGGEIVDAWIDPNTNLPLEVRICLDLPAHLTGGQAKRMWRVMTGFEYDVPVDPALLSVEAPLGYAAIQMPDVPIGKPKAAASLADLVDLLRLCARHNGATFPSSLSMGDEPGSCMAIMKAFANSQENAFTAGTEAQKQAVMQAAGEFGTAMGRATQFLFGLRPENKFHYAGRGVKLDAPKTPILWYLPAGAMRYKVVYADLSVAELDEAALPKLPEPAPAAPKERPNIRSTSPRVKLPQAAVKDFKALQQIRSAGKQADVRFLDLWLTPEFRQDDRGDDPKARADTARFKFLEELPNLEGLKLDYLWLTENDLAAIGRCGRLKQLSLSGVMVVEASGGKHFLRGAEMSNLSPLVSLEKLDLSQADFGDGLKHLAGLPQLHTLILSSFEHINDASLARLKELPHLETLVLAGVYAQNPQKTVTDAGLASLQNIASLRTLYVDYHGKWTLPVEKLQSLLPNVEVQPGFLEENPR